MKSAKETNDLFLGGAWRRFSNRRIVKRSQAHGAAGGRREGMVPPVDCNLPLSLWDAAQRGLEWAFHVSDIT